jgi:hypothetical protein
MRTWRVTRELTTYALPKHGEGDDVIAGRITMLVTVA